MTGPLRSFVAALAAAALAACGGGAGGDTSSAPSTASVGASQGTMTKTAATSIAVNGIVYEVGAAAIRIDDRAGTAAELKSGMTVRVLGSDDGTRGTAREVEVENEVRGAVTSVSASSTPPFFMIGAVKVIVDSGTVFDDLVPASFAAIAPGVFVEVHGLRDAAGNVIATRIEGKGMRNPAAPEVDELRGVITAVGANRFNLGGVVVGYTGTTVFTPAARCSPAALVVGLVVEVHGAFTGTNAFAATRVDCEDLEDAGRRPGNGQKNKIEGFVTGLDTNTRTFTLNGQLVAYGATTEFRNGSVEDLVNNAKVEVEGTMNGGTLLAREIKFKRVRVILTTSPSAVGANTLTLFGKVVTVSDLTEIRARDANGNDSPRLTDIVAHVDRVEVRAFVDAGGAIVAERVTEIVNSGGGRDVVQARVVAENEAARTLGLLDAAAPINAALAGTSQFEDDDGRRLTAEQFFAAVVPASPTNAGTLVKLKGRFAGGVLLVEEAELED